MYRHRPNFRRTSVLLLAFLSGGVLLAAESRGERISAGLLNSLDALDGLDDEHVSLCGFDLLLENDKCCQRRDVHRSRARGTDWAAAFLSASVAAMLAEDDSSSAIEGEHARWDTLKRYSRQQRRMTVRRMVRPPSGGVTRRSGPPSRETYLFNLRRRR